VVKTKSVEKKEKPKTTSAAELKLAGNPPPDLVQKPFLQNSAIQHPMAE